MSDEDQLTDWVLRESDEEAVVNMQGSYGKPVIHRGDCQGRYKDMPNWAQPISETQTNAFWVTELARQQLKMDRTIEFCQHCTCERIAFPTPRPGNAV